MALLGGIAAEPARAAAAAACCFTHGGSGASGLAARAVDAYAQGYRYAMVTGAALALAGALVSLTRGAHGPRGRRDRTRAAGRLCSDAAGQVLCGGRIRKRPDRAPGPGSDDPASQR